MKEAVVASHTLYDSFADQLLIPMPILQAHGPKVTIKDSPIPKPGPNQVVTKVVFSGSNRKQVDEAWLRFGMHAN